MRFWIVQRDLRSAASEICILTGRLLWATNRLEGRAEYHITLPVMEREEGEG